MSSSLGWWLKGSMSRSVRGGVKIALYIVIGMNAWNLVYGVQKCHIDSATIAAPHPPHWCNAETPNFDL